MIIAFGERLKVIAFPHEGVINSFKFNNVSEITNCGEVIGDNYRSVEEAIDAGEKAWLDSGKKLHYRIENMYGEELLTRYSNMDYTLADAGMDINYTIEGKMQSIDYIREHFEG